VIVVARRENLLAEVVERITARGGNAVAMPTNLADLDAVDELVKSGQPVVRARRRNHRRGHQRVVQRRRVHTQMGPLGFDDAARHSR
jgi:hypothetical protein